jgi:hypothetical protein
MRFGKGHRPGEVCLARHRFLLREALPGWLQRAASTERGALLLMQGPLEVCNDRSSISRRQSGVTKADDQKLSMSGDDVSEKGTGDERRTAGRHML